MCWYVLHFYDNTWINLNPNFYRSIDTDDFKGNCPEEQDTYADFGLDFDVNLDISSEPKGKFKLLKTINEAIELLDNEWLQEQRIELKKKQAATERMHKFSSQIQNSGSKVYIVQCNICIVLIMFYQFCILVLPCMYANGEILFNSVLSKV